MYKGSETMVKYALLIGINYSGADQLYGCINDVNNMKSFLESRLGYTNFILLTDNTPLKPTKKNIINAINSLVENLNPGDEAWFHYSGHGVLVNDFNNDEKSGYDTCIAPIDYKDKRSGGGFISDDTLRSILIEKIPTGVKLYVVLDACHSGTGCDLRHKYDDFSVPVNKGTNPLTYVPSEWSLQQRSYEFKNYKKTNGDIVCFSGCQDNQESGDTYIESDQMYGGVLTSTMLSLLKSNDLKIYKLKHLLKDICCSQKANGYAQLTALTSGKPLNLENAVFSFPDQNSTNSSRPSRPSRPLKKNIVLQARHKIQIKRMIFT